MRADELLRHRYFVSDQIPASSLPRKYSATNADYRNTRKYQWANQFTKRIRGALRATGIKRKNSRTGGALIFLHFAPHCSLSRFRLLEGRCFGLADRCASYVSGQGITARHEF